MWYSGVRFGHGRELVRLAGITGREETAIRMKKTFNEQKDPVLVIQSHHKIFTIASWKYFEIVDLLRDMGLSHIEATDAAKWAGRAPPGTILQVDDLRLEVTI